MRTNDSRPWTVQSLPVFSPVASRLLTMASQDGVSFTDLSNLIEMDAALTTDVLRLANSPLYARRNEISGILKAIAFLGIEAVRGMVLTVALRNFSRAATGAQVFRQCWRHNLACALLAADLAKINRMERDVGYSLGLLHDAGRLALLATSPITYNRLLQIGASSSEEMLSMEREIFGMDHCQGGEWLAQTWELPADFRRVMSHHHDPRAGQRGSALIVHLACGLADMAGFSAWGSGREWDTTELQECMPKAGREILDAGKLIPRVAERINSVECALMR